MAGEAGVANGTAVPAKGPMTVELVELGLVLSANRLVTAAIYYRSCDESCTGYSLESPNLFTGQAHTEQANRD